MFQVFLTGNNSEYFTISPTAVQGRADIRMRVAMPLDFEHIRTYSFSVGLKLITSIVTWESELWGPVSLQKITQYQRINVRHRFLSNVAEEVGFLQCQYLTD